MWKLGRRIQANRERLGMKQEELAELAELSVNYISAIERGVKCPSLDAFVRIANALEVSSDELLRDSLAVRFDIRSTDLGERISLLKPRDKEVILDVVALLVKHAQRNCTGFFQDFPAAAIRFRRISARKCGSALPGRSSGWNPGRISRSWPGCG